MHSFHESLEFNSRNVENVRCFSRTRNKHQHRDQRMWFQHPRLNTVENSRVTIISRNKQTVTSSLEEVSPIFSIKLKAFSVLHKHMQTAQTCFFWIQRFHTWFCATKMQNTCSSTPALGHHLDMSQLWKLTVPNRGMPLILCCLVAWDPWFSVQCRPTSRGAKMLPLKSTAWLCKTLCTDKILHNQWSSV